MPRRLLDTSAYSVLIRGSQSILALLQEADEIYTTPIILGELHAGFRADSRRKENEQRLSRFLSSPRVRIATIGDETSFNYAEILNYLKTAGLPVPTNDIWIAASAMQHGLRIVTTDIHFTRIPQVLVDYGA